MVTVTAKLLFVFLFTLHYLIWTLDGGMGPLYGCLGWLSGSFPVMLQEGSKSSDRCVGRFVGWVHGF